MALRNIIEIDEEKCNGCGLCIIDCAEAALQIVNGKARLIKEIYCDGLGACLGSCPTGALAVVQREAAPFDEAATEEHMQEAKKMNEGFCGCAGTKPVVFTEKTIKSNVSEEEQPELQNWPIQLKLIGTGGAYLNDADILLAADCTAFSAVGFHSRFIKGKKVIIGCPKLDNAQQYFEQLTGLFKNFSIKSVSVVRMEVPCCGGLAYITQQAIKNSGKDILYSETVIGVKGDIKKEGMTPLIPKIQAV
jgi:ferredoxin